MKVHANNGITLIGVLVSVFILAGAAVAITQLVSRNQQVVEISRDQFVATALAREGLELVQAHRDTNWFVAAQGEPERTWYEELCNAGETREILIEHDAFGINIIEDVTNPRLYQTNDGVFSHTATDGPETMWARTIRLDCTQVEPADEVTEAAVMRVESRVSWQRRGNDREVVLATELYDWYR